MNVTKLPSGHYRIRQDYNGRTYSMTVPYKPGKFEAEELIHKVIEADPENRTGFYGAARQYIEAKKNVLSPSTVREYTCTLRNLPDSLTRLELYEIDNLALQTFVNDMAADHNPKSVRNAYGFVRAVIRFFNPNYTCSATLPQNRRTERYTPSQDDVRAILEEAKGTHYYPAIYLAVLSLRCSEICALTPEDLDGNKLTINKAYVRSNDGYVVKPCAKTDKSNRVLIIPDELADAIREQGYIFPYHPNQISKWLRRAQKRLGIPEFGVHRLRHFFASYSHNELHYPDAVIQDLGGWSTGHIMTKIYRHAMEIDSARQSIASDFSSKLN